MDTTATTLTGHIDYFIHPRNGQLTEENDFGIAHFQIEDHSQEPLIIKGSLFGVQKNERIRAYGAWETHAKYGRQFAVTNWERPLPTSTEQVISYLTSKFVKGCGIKRAELIAQHLGEQAIERIMQEGADCLLGIKGVGRKNATKIADSIKCNFEIQQIMMALLPYGITAELISKAYAACAWGTECVDIIRRNPYRLTELHLISFVKADEIALQIGIDVDSPYRLNAALHHTLNEMCYSNGHCYVLEQMLIDRTMQFVRGVDQREIWTELQLMAAHEQVIWESDRVYPKSLYIYESKLAYKVSCMVQRPAQPAPNLHQLIREYQREKGIVLAEKQSEAIRALFANHLLIITGNPGTGKTTIVQAMLDLYRHQYPKARIGLCAPTGRAARKLGQVAGMPSETIHMMIGLRPGVDPAYGEDMPLPVDLIVVDEASMMDIQLAYYIFQAVSHHTKVIMIGDSDQLPSVSPGHVLHDMIAAGVPHVRLNQIFRQAQESQIIMNAHRINCGEPIVVDPCKDDFYFMEHSEPERIKELIVRSVVRFLDKGYSLEHILVLSPMKKGTIGTEELNKAIQTAVNPPSLNKIEFAIGERLYRQGDKVIQTRNDYEKNVLNGDIGVVIGTGYLSDEKGDLTDELGLICSFQDKQILYSKQELKHVLLAYAITIHKAQGGQAPIVIMPVCSSHYMMLARNLIYTGLTRAERVCVMIGTQRALHIAIGNNKIIQRNTGLREKIGQF